MACTTGCPTQDCPSYGACLRRKGVKVGWADHVNGLDRSADKRHEAELSAYRDARSQGIQPDGTTMPQVKAALEISDQLGAAYQGTA